MQQGLQSSVENVVEFVSEEEKYFRAWLDEAVKAGLVLSYKYQPKAFTLSQRINFPTKGKGKKMKENVLLNSHEYQADFAILWTVEAIRLGLVRHILKPDENGVFVYDELPNFTMRSVVDVKGSFSLNKNDSRFPLNQKWVYDKYKIYVQKIVPFGSGSIDKWLFSLTWTPREYAFRPMKNGKGFLKNQCNVRMINEYLKLQNNGKIQF